MTFVYDPPLVNVTKIVAMWYGKPSNTVLCGRKDIMRLFKIEHLMPLYYTFKQ